MPARRVKRPNIGRPGDPLPAGRMPSRWRFAVVLAAVVWSAGCATTRPGHVAADLGLDGNSPILCDHANQYSAQGLVRLGGGLAAAAVWANSGADDQFQYWYQSRMAGDDGDTVAHVFKRLGDGNYVLPVLAGALLAGEVAGDSPACECMGDWGDRSLRAALVGAPPLLFAQVATGASRPEEEKGPNWHPFQDENGASGHAFIGAIPLITAAQMSDDPLTKAGCYFASTLAAWSRIHDDSHYASQAALGWWLAYAACSAVNETEQDHQLFELTPVPLADGLGIGIILRR